MRLNHAPLSGSITSLVCGADLVRFRIFWKEVTVMKLVGDLKDKVEKADNKEEAKELIKDAGMELTDEEMDQVAGGAQLKFGMENDPLYK